MKSIRELFTWRNLIPLITIIIAFLAVFGLPQSLGITNETIILALLGLLSIDLIVERFGYLRRIERQVNILSTSTSKIPFTNRAALNDDEHFEDFISHGQDLIISGVSLVGTVGPYRAVFKKAAQEGTNFRFLLPDPDSDWLDSAALSHGIAPESLRLEIQSSLGQLMQIIESLNKVERGKINVKLLQVFPNAGIAIRDGYKRNGEIRCELYLYQTDVGGRPAFRLRPEDGKYFDYYRDAIEQLWKDSLVWDTNRST